MTSAITKATTETKAVTNAILRGTLQWLFNRHAVTLSKPGQSDFVSLFAAGLPMIDGSTISSFLNVTSVFNDFVQFRPVSGATLVQFQYSEYPFANRTVAANSASLQPTRIDVEMFIDLNTTGITDALAALGVTIPSNGGFVRYSMILPFMQALITKLKDHQIGGGAFTVCTPSQIYFNCLLESIRDVSDTQDGEPGGLRYVMSFYKPLISKTDAEAVLNSVASGMSSGGKVS